MHDGRVRRAYLGLVSTPARLTPVQAERYRQRGALRVVEVVERSPAAQSGFLAGDLVLAIDGAPLGDAQSLQKHLFADAIGRRMEVTVIRNGALVDAVVMPQRTSQLRRIRCRNRASPALRRRAAPRPVGHASLRREAAVASPS